MKRQVKEKVAHVVTQNRTSVMSEESGQSFVEDHRFGESAPVGLTLGSVSVPFLVQGGCSHVQLVQYTLASYAMYVCM